MDAKGLEAYLHSHIPLSAAMQVSVVEAGPDAVVLSAPLEPNINHSATVFGGSASAVAILSAWSLVHLRLEAEGRVGRIVIFRNTMNYVRPIDGTFTARAEFDADANWPHFLEMFDHMGMARVGVASTLDYAGKVAGRFTGQFVALTGAGH